MDAVRLQVLERSFPVGSSATISPSMITFFDTQQFQGIDKFGVVAVEIRSVARDEPNLFTTLKAYV